MTSYTPVLDASDYPFSAVVSIHVTYSDWSISRGTGVVIGPNDVLTSAHVVQPEPGLRVRSIEVVPGFDDGIMPFGAFSVSFRRWFAVDRDGDGKLSVSDVERDYAVLTVENPQPIGDVTGWFGLLPNAANPFQSIYLESAGYPEGLQPAHGDLSMYRTFGFETFDGTVIEHDLRNETGVSWAGASGSPFWQDESDGPYVVAILSTTHHATYIDGGVLANLMDWISENDAQSLAGTRGKDRLFGGIKDDVLKGNAGRDLLYGRGGDDLVQGGRGGDRIFGGTGRDELRGGAGWDVIRGGGGQDRLLGGPGADLIDGGGGIDIAIGGRGADRFHFERGDGKANLVRGFDPDHDSITIGAGARRKSDLAVDNNGGDALLEFADVTAIFSGVARWQLLQSDFDFA